MSHVRIDENAFNEGVNRVLRLRPVSRAFRSGFISGFTSPFKVFGQSVRHKYPSPSNSDVQAWHDVGEILSRAYRDVGKEIVDPTKKK